MTDQVHPGENSQEQIAYKLLLYVAQTESKNTPAKNYGTPPDRKWILDTYAECLQTVQMPYKRFD